MSGREIYFTYFSWFDNKSGLTPTLKFNFDKPTLHPILSTIIIAIYDYSTN